MLSVSLLFTLLGLSLSVEHSLLGLIRKNPTALMTMFDVTGAHRFDEIIQILNELVVEANTEINQTETSIETCQAEVTNAFNALEAARTELSRLNLILDTAKQNAVSASGVLAAKQKIYDTESPSLLHEIEVYENVTSIIQGLDTDVTLEDLVQIRAFLSTAQQADPDKVQKVIDLLNTLLSAAQQELEQITTALDEANTLVINAEKAEQAAAGEVSGGEADEAAALENYNQLNGACQTTASLGAARITVLRGEIETLNEILDMLNSMP